VTSLYPLRALARGAVGAMATAAVLFVVAFAAAVVGRVQIGDAIGSDDLTYRDLTAILLRTNVPGQVLFLPLVLAGSASIGLFVAWLYGARRNLDRIDRAQPKWGWGWTLAGWVIPVANVVVPAVVVADVARESMRSAGRRRATMSWLVLLWWLTVLGWLTLAALPSARTTPAVGISIMYSSYTDRVDPTVRHRLAEQLVGPLLPAAEVASVGLLVAAAALGIVLVRQITAAQFNCPMRTP
jgi:hypothetical protein